MAIRWEDIQNLVVTEDEVNLLAGLTATSAELNQLSSFTGTASDLNDLIGTDIALAAHEALGFETAHPILANSLDGLLIVDNTITEGKLAFDVATQTELDAVQLQITDIESDGAVRQGQIDNLYSIVIPGQGSDLADAIQQTVDHIDKTDNAHDATAISYGNNYVLTADLATLDTSLVLNADIIKHFRVGETIRFQDDVTPTEDAVLLAVDYNTYAITFAALTNSYTTANNAIIWVLSEDSVQEGVDRSLRNNTDIFTGRLTVDQTGTDQALVISKSDVGSAATVTHSAAGDVLSLSGQTGSDELVFNQGTIRSAEGYNLDLADTKTFLIENDTAGERFKVDTLGDVYLTQAKLREEGTAFHGTLTKQTLTADRTWTFRDLDMIIGNPDLTGNALKYLRVNAGETDTEWIIISAPEVTYDNTISGLAAVNVKEALDEIDDNLDLHEADTSIHFLETAISHLNILDIGTNSHANIDTHIADDTLHRIINDAATSFTELWSANKIDSELSLKSDATHNHTLDSLSNVDTTGVAAGSILEWNGTTDWIIGTKGEINTASNLTGTEGVFSAKVGSDLQFKSLVAGANISLSSDANGITIGTSGGLGEANTVSNIGGANSIFKQKTGVDLEFRTLAAGANITITSVGDTLSIASTGGSSSGGGTAITRTQVAHGFSLLDGIYHDGSIWQKAQANDPDTLAEYVVTDIVGTDDFTANKFGEATITAHGETVGEHYYLSDSVAGGSQTTEPTNYSNPLYYVEDANTIHVEVYRPSEVTEVIGDQIDWQTKLLSANATTDGVMSDLTFNNLEIGKSYKITSQIAISSSSGDYVQVLVDNGTTRLIRVEDRGSAAGDNQTVYPSTIFTATATVLTFDVQSIAGGSLIQGDGTKNYTWVQLEELPVHQTTTKWT